MAASAIHTSPAGGDDQSHLGDQPSPKRRRQWGPVRRTMTADAATTTAPAVAVMPPRARSGSTSRATPATTAATPAHSTPVMALIEMAERMLLPRGPAPRCAPRCRRGGDRQVVDQRRDDADPHRAAKPDPVVERSGHRAVLHRVEDEGRRRGDQHEDQPEARSDGPVRGQRPERDDRQCDEQNAQIMSSQGRTDGLLRSAAVPNGASPAPGSCGGVPVRSGQRSRIASCVLLPVPSWSGSCVTADGSYAGTEVWPPTRRPSTPAVGAARGDDVARATRRRHPRVRPHPGASIPGHDVTVIAPRMPGAAPTEVVDGVRIQRVGYFLRRWEGLATEAIMPTLRAHPWRVIEAPFLFGALVMATWSEVAGTGTGRGQRPLDRPRRPDRPGGPPRPAPLRRHRARRRRLHDVRRGGSPHQGARAGRGGRRAARERGHRHDARAGWRSGPADGRGHRRVRAAVDLVPNPACWSAIGRLADKKGVDVLIEAWPRPAAAASRSSATGPTVPPSSGAPRRLGWPTACGSAARCPAAVLRPWAGAGGGDPVPSRCRRGHGRHPRGALRGHGRRRPGRGLRPGWPRRVHPDGVDGLLVPPDDVDALVARSDSSSRWMVDLDCPWCRRGRPGPPSLEARGGGRATCRCWPTRPGSPSPPLIGVLHA